MIMKNQERKSFLVYLDWEKNINKMSLEERGYLLTLLFDKYNRKDIQPIPEKYPILDIMWDGIVGVIDRNLKQYDDKINTVSRQSTDSMQTVLKQSTESIPTKDKDKVTVNDNVKEEDKVKVISYNSISKERLAELANEMFK